MATFNLLVNGNKFTVDAEPDTPLLWVLRDSLGLTGTKFGCGQSQCGSCTVLVDNEPVFSCSVSVQNVQNRNIQTIEEIAEKVSDTLLKYWIAEEASQCGYCQPGQIISAYALLKKNSKPSGSEIKSAMSSHLCRCGMYQRINKAIARTIVSGGLK